jgi:fucose 4-O-acetylase-like acetyltransferase
MKGILMFLVILSHAGVPRIYTRFYTPIFLTGFFFCSGYTLNLNRKPLEFCKSKIRTLVVPFILLGTINAICAMLYDGDSFQWRIRCLLLNQNNVDDDMWFIACMFCSELIVYLIIKYIYDDKLRVLASLIVSLLGLIIIKYSQLKLLWNLETALLLNCFLLFGYIYKSYEDKLEIIKNANKYVFVGIGLYIFSVLCYDNNVNVHGKEYENIWMFFVSSLIGLFVTVTVVKMIDIRDSNVIHRWILYVGRNTLVYYAFQSKVLRLLDLVIKKTTLNNIYITSVLKCLCTGILLVAPAIIINKFCPVIVGKKKY